MSPADPFCLKNHALNFNLKKWNPGLCIFNHRAKRKHNPQMFTTLNWMYLSSVIFVSPGETSLSSLSFLHLFFYCFPKTLFPHIICSLSLSPLVILNYMVNPNASSPSLQAYTLLLSLCIKHLPWFHCCLISMLPSKFEHHFYLETFLSLSSLYSETGLETLDGALLTPSYNYHRTSHTGFTCLLTFLLPSLDHELLNSMDSAFLNFISRVRLSID